MDRPGAPSTRGQQLPRYVGGADETVHLLCAGAYSILQGGDCVQEIGKNVPFERIRRITGYLVGTLDKWNDAKKAEEADRVKHTAPQQRG